jgi:hypothetical protein
MMSSSVSRVMCALPPHPVLRAVLLLLAPARGLREPTSGELFIQMLNSSERHGLCAGVSEVFHNTCFRELPALQMLAGCSVGTWWPFEAARPNEGGGPLGAILHSILKRLLGRRL